MLPPANSLHQPAEACYGRVRTTLGAALVGDPSL